jgi:hypothetical protein
MSYNGWTNWATWQINLWLDSEEPLYREKQRYLRRASDEIDAKEAEAWCRAAFMCHFDRPFTPDMTRADLMAVNWQEIADHLNEEAAEYADPR